MHATITIESPLVESPRATQVRGMFDLAAQRSTRLQWQVTLPFDERPWHIGLIAGPSGCGKSTIARHFWPNHIHREFTWPAGASILDGFPADLSIKDVTALLSAVGFSSPPAWLRPFGVLSTGQQFRVTLARLLAEAPELAVMDEYTSVVDRTVAQIGSAALAKVVRQRGQRFVAVTCHEDVEAWLQPDWVYRPAENVLAWRCLQRRPPITLAIVRCRTSAWRLFAPHHYLSHHLHPGAVCFLASWRDRPVAFSAWLPFLGAGPPARREHRTVTLPDFQGVGIGNALSGTIAALWKALGYRALSTTTHPALMRARQKSPHWRMHRAPSLAAGPDGGLKKLRHATTRLTAGFEYVGPGLPGRLARLLLAS
jgi:energy-coupling factor transporter ATP-binding protein EcfA2/GNAT superfamily N-acetyltransferase